ncbi:MAG: APC family permease [Mucilaginibacter sp.]
MPSAAYLKKIRPIQLIAIVFFTVSGGPYGLEQLLVYAGHHGALMLILITPLLWDVPAMLTVLELNSIMPVTGGYYRWVKFALGTKWGFYEGWWTWLYTFVDLAIYPVLFVQYASFFYPELIAYKIPICLTIIWLSAGLNVLGIVPVGRVSLFLGGAVLAPFIILFAIALYHHGGGLYIPSPSLKGVSFPSFGMALYTIMWNCLGWDNTTTYVEEVENPVRSYLISVFTAFALVLVIYLLVIWVSILSGISATALAQNGFPAVGAVFGGYWLGALIAAGGMASTLGIYAAVLLSVSRVPQAMAEDGLLPGRINILHSRFQTPYVSILICSAIVSLMILWTFADLIVIDVIVYGAGLSLEYLSLISLRIKLPDISRPFKIPLNIAGICLMLLLPVSVYFIALGGAFSSSAGMVKPAVFALAALLSAELMWRLLNLKRIIKQ